MPSRGLTAEPAVIGIFDAGIGGVPIGALLEAKGHKLVYLGDAARRPYGPQTNELVAEYLAEAEQFFAQAGCDAWVIACNTASVVAEQALRGLVPCVDMVSAVVHDFPPSGQGPLGLLGTAGTVASGAFPRALSTYEVHQVATEELLRLAEEGGGDNARLRALSAEAFQVLRENGCRDAILACTDFTCVKDELASEAGEINLVDPLYAAVRLLDERLSSLGRRSDTAAAEHRLILTGPHPVDVPTYARERFGLELPEPEYRALAPVGVAIAET